MPAVTRFVLLALVLMATLAGCSDDGDSAEPATTATTEATTSAASGQMFPDVVSAVARRTGGGTWEFSVTVSSPYDSDERYADAWRVLAPDGTVLGERILAHPHQDEQPFTRSLGDVDVPPGVRSVTISARDSRNGYGDGKALEVGLTPGRD